MCTHGLSENISSQLAARTNMALANNTKSNYNTVKNNIKRCESALNCDLGFPWTITQTLHFTAYLLYICILVCNEYKLSLLQRRCSGLNTKLLHEYEYIQENYRRVHFVWCRMGIIGVHKSPMYPSPQRV